MNNTWAGIFFLAILLFAPALAYRPLGDYLANVLEGSRHIVVERVFYRLGGVDAEADQTWSRYLRSVPAPSAWSACCSCTCSCLCSSTSGRPTPCR